MNVNGFTLKAVKVFKGHEGEPCFQGNIYLNDKKVGRFSSSYTMGPMDILFDSSETEHIFNELVSAFFKVYPQGFLFYNAPFIDNPATQEFAKVFDAEDLILEMLAIDEAEKSFKMGQRRLCPLLIYTYGAKGTTGYGFTKHISKEAAVAFFEAKNEKVILYADSLKVFEIEV